MEYWRRRGRGQEMLYIEQSFGAEGYWDIINTTSLVTERLPFMVSPINSEWAMDDHTG